MMIIDTEEMATLESDEGKALWLDSFNGQITEMINEHVKDFGQIFVNEIMPLLQAKYSSDSKWIFFDKLLQLPSLNKGAV